MKILVHTDSAFNSLYFVRWLRKQQWEVIGYFYNPNIQPYAEYNKCLLMQKLLGVLEDIVTIYAPKYDFEDYLEGSSQNHKQKERCQFCYRFILERVAQYAKKLDIAYFTTSWLLHPHHDHKLLKKIGDEVAVKYGIKFLFQDFAKEWEEADQLAVKMNLYEQPYCGCIYSERYRFYPTSLDEYDKVQAKKKKGKAAVKHKNKTKSAAAKKK